MTEITQSTSKIILNGLKLKCPKCGTGKLFKSYLKPQDHCPYCNEQLGHIRADDGPAWLTILIAGHIAVFLLLHLQQAQNLTYTLEMTIILGTVLSSILILLPCSKGLFIALLWHIQQKNESDM